MYSMFTHSCPFIPFVFLSLSVPAVPQFDPGFGGIVSNSQRVRKEV